MENQQQQNTPLCRGGCGFYGSPATEDLCSKCFKDMINRKQEAPQGAAPVLASAQQSKTAVTLNSMPSGLTSSGDAETVFVACTSDSDALALSGAKQSNTQKMTGVDAKIGENLSTAAIEVIGSLSTETAASTGSLSSDGCSAQPPTPKKNRCGVCNKRVGLTGFECRCGGLYCGEHRYDSAHDCTFDYKTAGREELRKKNPQVISDKIQKI